jgi:glyoxylase-like metal-dependent hydrolase (beta-lactamase superfamily II)
MKGLALLGALGLGACEAPAEVATIPAPRVPRVDVSAEPRIFDYTEGGVTVHTFVSPDVSESVTSHVIETPHGLVVVDTQMLRHYAKKLRAYVDGLGKPVTHVIISHAHPDHYFGLEFFADLPTYALQSTIDRMHRRSAGHRAAHKAREGDEIIDEIVYPQNVLRPGTITLDGVEFVFDEVPKGEDVSQLLITIPRAKTMIVQDLASGHYHAFTGTLLLDDWSARLGRLYEIAIVQGYTHILPGHGTPGGPSLFLDTQAYIAKAKEAFASVKTQEQYVRAMRVAFPDLHGDYIIEVSALLWDRDRPHP